MYSVHEYGDMLADRGRTEAYAAALRAHVTPTSVVADVGAGPGILTLLACRAGARHVYAIEPDPVLELAREAVRENGFADRVTFIEAPAADVSLPEPVDVVVSDLHGVLPFFGEALRSLIDVRRRWMSPSGRFIPARDTVWAALVNAPRHYGATVGNWTDGGFEWSGARRRAVNQSRKLRVRESELVVEPRIWTTIDYGALEDSGAAGRVDWTLTAEATIHGLCIWFDSEFSQGVYLSNSPRASEPHVYGHVFLPWPEPRVLGAGCDVSVLLRSDAVGDSYILSWTTEIRRPGAPLEALRQSEFLGNPVSVDWLRKGAASFTPQPNQDAEIDREILDGVFARRTLEDVARSLAMRFPRVFPDWRRALTRVASLSLRYSK